MNWYYIEAGQQAGPVDDTGLYNLYTSGRVTADTLVWNETMTDWQPYNGIRAQVTPAAVATAVADAPPVVSSTEAVCAECGKIFPVDDTISYGNARVCAGCKPIFVQKLSEGVNVDAGYVPGTFRYAGFWIRFGAFFIDAILLNIVGLVVNFVFGFALGATGSANSNEFNPIMFIPAFFNLCLGLGYETFMIGKYGATLGKMACRIQVVNADGTKVSYGKAIGRYLAKFISSLICLIGYIMAGFDDEKRALHDRICSTRVIHKS